MRASVPPRPLFGVLFAALLLSCPAAGYAQTLEYAVKANYLVRFAVFVQWPSDAFSSAEAPVTICVAGRNRFGAVLADAAGEHTAHGRPIAVRSVRSSDQVSGCHMVYRGSGAPTELAAAAATAGGVLLITDQAVSRRRGAVHFDVSDGRVRFHIDNNAARRAGLSISSRLLSLALSVSGERR